MFEQEVTTPWYRSPVALVVSAVLLPPLGLVLLWRHSGLDTRKKVLISLGICALLAGYVYLYAVARRNSIEDHYAQLEHHRAEQRQQAAQETAAATNTANTNTQLNANAASAQNPQQPGASTAAGSPDAAHAGEAARAARNYWTDFRGPARDGRYDEVAIRTSWPANGLPQLWKQPVGGGYASFVVAEGRAYTIEQRRNQEVVAAYDVETGRELWTHGWNAEFRESLGGDGPRATPTWNDGRLYALGAAGEFRCLDAKTGKLVWNRNILSENGAQNIEWGMAASPLIVDDKVIVLPGGLSGKSVVAYNRLSGAPLWKVLNDQASYTSPMLVTLAGRRQVLVVTASRIVGLAPEDGALLWETPWQNSASINVSQPIAVDQNRFFISGGYGKGAALVEVTGAGRSFSARKVWENNSMKNKFNSSVLHNGYVYGLDEGILSCVEVTSGERKWKGGRYGYGQVLLASGHLVITTENGEIVLVRATPESLVEVARFSALEGRTWNNPAIAQGRLLVRNATEMAAYNIAAQ
ncbi:MAG TPA: PQQ-binding-like beta-propeller repeat protein [Pyrinomonadaceae bacterium]|jgi:outer membrane protein assembly factor BamB|nr:PQQ-binding-like beta-propeller repeat protein [Pyrinomonadaceae bacterium]